MTEFRRPTFFQAIARGFHGRCPRCNEGQLFWKYLKVEEHCPACGHDLSQYRADDGPAYFTILIVGHLLVGPIFFFPIIWEANLAITIPAILIPLTIATLLLLPRVKGAFIGALYILGVRERDAALHTADVAD
jgi:uncharacterized protein (DUF983 family)